MTVTATGPVIESGTANSSGAGTISNLTAGNYTATASRSTADLGNAITAADALAALKLDVGLITGPAYEYMAADVNGDGKITAADAIGILDMVVGLPNAPAPDWEFVNAAGTYVAAATSVPPATIGTISVPQSTSLSLIGILVGDVNGKWSAGTVEPLFVDGGNSVLAVESDITAGASPSFYFESQVVGGMAQVQVWVDAGASLESADLDLTFNSNEGTYSSFTPASGWFDAANVTSPGTLIVSTAGLSPVGKTADGLLGTITFAPVAGAADLGVSGTVEDSSDSSGDDYGLVSLGTIDVPITRTFAWDAASGAWSSAANWSTEGGPPTSEDEAVFQNGAGVVSGSGNAGTLDFAAGMWRMEGTIAVAGETDVGESGAAELTIGGGGSVVGGGGATIAAAVGTDTSSVSVTGNNSIWALGGQLEVGDAAEGSLAVASQGRVTASTIATGIGAAATGVISVDGAGSSIVDGGDLIVGNAGVGELSISNGATVTAAGVQLGLLADSSGNVDIEGTGSTFTVTDDVDIGVGGLGVLTVGPGATLDVVGNLNEGAEGVLNIVGGVVDPGNGVLGGNDPISNGGTLVYTGTLTLTGTISVTGCTGELDVGTLTGPGTLDVGDGGNLVLADAEGGDGAIAVVGSSVPTIQFLGSAGTLTVENGSVLGGLDVTSFAADDIIALPNLVFAATAIAAPGTVDLLDAAGGVVGAMQYGGQVSGAVLAAGIVGGGHSLPAGMVTH